MDPSTPVRAVIFDIDGVIADAAGRQHYLDWGDWKGFFDAVGDDPIIEEIERLLELLDASLRVILVTGRPRRVQPQTVAWLERYSIRWDLLDHARLRRLLGRRSIQARDAARAFDEGFDIRLALDDDPKNHAMYMSEGVPCIYIHSGYYL